MNIYLAYLFINYLTIITERNCVESMLSRAFVRPSAPPASRWVEYLTLHHRRFCSKNSLHPTSVISENAVLSPDVVVGPFCVVSGGTTIGEGVVLQAGVHIFGHSRIGAKCVIRSHAVIGAEVSM